MLNNADGICEYIVSHEESEELILLFENYFDALEYNFQPEKIHDKLIVCNIFLRCLRISGDMVKFNSLFDKHIQPLVTFLDFMEFSPFFIDLNVLSDFYNLIGQILATIGQYSVSLDFFERCLIVREIIGEDSLIANINNNLGLIYQYTGNIQKGEEYFLKNVKHYQETENIPGLISSYNNLLSLHNSLGNFNIAIKYGLESFDLIKKHDQRDAICLIMDNLAYCFLQLDDIENAYTYYKEASISCQRLDREVHTNINLALFYYEIGYYDMGYELLDKYVKKCRQNGLKFNLAAALFGQIIHAMQLDKEDEIDPLFEEFSEIVHESGEIRLTKRYELLKGVILLNKPKIRENIEGYKILKDALERYQIRYDNKIIALISISEYLLKEYQIQADRSLIDELFEITKNFRDMVSKHDQPSNLIKLLILESRIYQTIGDLEKSLEKLQEANEISEANNFYRKSFLIADQRNKLLRNFRENSASELSAQPLEFNKYLNSVRNLSIISDNQADLRSHLLLVFQINQSEKGLNLLLEYEFSSTEVDKGAISDQISYQLDNLQSSGTFELENYEDIVLTYKRRDNQLYCYILSGNTFLSKVRLDYIIDVITRAFPDLSQHQIFSEELKHQIITYLDNLRDPDVEHEEFVIASPNFSSLDPDLEIILHPIRFQIIRILNIYYQLPRSDILHILDIPSSTLHNHVEKLKEHGLIKASYDFKDSKPAKILYITSHGAKLYEKLEHIF